MSPQENNHEGALGNEPARRRGDRRLADLEVPSDRRKIDRREKTPGLGALVRTLLHRDPKGEA